MRKKNTALLILALALASVMAWPLPWEVALLLACLVLAVLAWSARSDTSRIILINLAAVFFALAAFEAWLAAKAAAGDGTRLEGTITEGFTVPHPDLGYHPRAGSHVTARKLHGAKIIYDVDYTIGPDGSRVSPPSVPSPSGRCVVFFGDSVTFGEGVADREAFPFRVAERLGPGNSVHNFAFSGYGPHQMLALLQSSAPDARAGCRPTDFVYLAILEHVARVGGLTSWDYHGPRYRLDDGGRAVRDGNFDAPTRLLGRWDLPAGLASELDRCHTWQRFLGRNRSPGRPELDLYLGIVKESARLAAQRYPGSLFQVLLWDGRDDERLAVIERELASADIRVHRITQAIPDFTGNASRYLLSPYDGHPNSVMHERLAGYVVDAMLPLAGDRT